MGRRFVAAAILRWLGAAGIDTALIDPGKPWQNATDESFNGKFRDECLSLQWFRNRVDTRPSVATSRFVGRFTVGRTVWASACCLPGHQTAGRPLTILIASTPVAPRTLSLKFGPLSYDHLLRQQQLAIREGAPLCRAKMRTTGDDGLAGVVRAVRAGADAAGRAGRDLTAASRAARRAGDTLGRGLQGAHRNVTRAVEVMRQSGRERGITRRREIDGNR